MTIRKTRIAIIISIVIIMAALVTMAMLLHITEGQDDSITEWDGKNLIAYASENPGIKIPGYSHLYFPADTQKVPITLWNPEDNDCLFLFTLYLEEENEPLYTSEFLEPDQAFEEITLNHPLPSGEYTLMIEISPYTMDKTTPLNRAQVSTELTVE